MDQFYASVICAPCAQRGDRNERNLWRKRTRPAERFLSRAQDCSTCRDPGHHRRRTPRFLWRHVPAQHLLLLFSCPAARLGQAPKSNRPARDLHLGNAMFPFMSSLATEVVNRPRRQRRRTAIEAARPSATEAHRRRRTTCSKQDRSRCHPIPAPGSYRISRAWTNSSGGKSAKRAARCRRFVG